MKPFIIKQTPLLNRRRHLKSTRLFTVLYFYVRLSRSRSFALRAAILHECQNYLGGGGGLGGSEKNRGTLITTLQLTFRRRDRNFTPFTIHSLGCVQTDATTPNIVAPTMLGVVACVLAVVCKPMQQLPTMLGPAVHRGKDTTHKSL